MTGESLRKFSFIWRIENYSSSSFQKNGESISSPEVIAENLGGSKWYFELNFSDDGEEEYKVGIEYACFYLSRSDEDLYEKDLEINYEIQIIDGDGKILAAHSKENSLFRKSDFQYFTVESEKISNSMMHWTEDVLTVQCLISCPEMKKETPTGCIAITKINENLCSFKWKVNYKSWSTFSARNAFSFTESSNFEITLSTQKDDLLIVIERKESSQMVHELIKGKIALLSAKGVEVESKRHVHLFPNDKDYEQWDFPIFLSRNLLENELLIDGPFTLSCEFSSSKSIEHSYISKFTYSSVSDIDSSSALKNDLKTIFKKQELTDVKLRVDSEIICAHKTILAARSPVFRTMFGQDMIEAKTGFVDIKDVDVTTLKNFLEYLYSGEIQNLDYENASKMLLVADKYRVLSLKELCSDFLMSALCVENVCDIIALADMVNEKQLKSSAMDFITKHASLILPSDKWSAWTKKHFELTTEIFSFISQNFQLIKKID